MIVGMVTVHMTETEVVSDIVAVLARVRQGVEIVVEQDHRTVAFIKPPKPGGPDDLRGYRRPEDSRIERGHRR